MRIFKSEMDELKTDGKNGGTSLERFFAESPSAGQSVEAVR
jgi:hypothetical protein